MKIENMEEVKKTIKNVIELFVNISEKETELLNEIQKQEDIQNDLLHELELAELNAIEMMRVARRLKATRKERREYKNQLKFINVLKGYTRKFTEKGIIAESQQLLKNIETYESNLKTRKYEARVLKDLKCTK